MSFPTPMTRWTSPRPSPPRGTTGNHTASASRHAAIAAARTMRTSATSSVVIICSPPYVIARIELPWRVGAHLTRACADRGVVGPIRGVPRCRRLRRSRLISLVIPLGPLLVPAILTTHQRRLTSIPGPSSRGCRTLRKLSCLLHQPRLRPLPPCPSSAPFSGRRPPTTSTSPPSAANMPGSSPRRTARSTHTARVARTSAHTRHLPSPAPPSTQPSSRAPGR